MASGQGAIGPVAPLLLQDPSPQAGVLEEPLGGLLLGVQVQMQVQVQVVQATSWRRSWAAMALRTFFLEVSWT